MDPKKLVNLINNNIKIIIDNFRLVQSKHDSSLYIIDGRSSALNSHKNSQETVRVLKWFNDFWLFLSIKFNLYTREIDVINKFHINTLISLSVFQGDDSDNKKYQLFRAEWDDYGTSEKMHAQPHWHITSSQALETIFLEYADFYNESEFVEEFEKEKQKVLDVKKIHFAMNGDWQMSGSHIHKIKDEQQVVKWLQGILSHLKKELKN
jgi:hypothetical protein